MECKSRQMVLPPKEAFLPKSQTRSNKYGQETRLRCKLDLFPSLRSRQNIDTGLHLFRSVSNCFVKGGGGSREQERVGGGVVLQITEVQKELKSGNFQNFPPKPNTHFPPPPPLRPQRLRLSQPPVFLQF